MFSVGELVCYPMHGVGHIESVCEQTVLGKTEKFYKLRFVNGNMTAMLPVDSAETVGLRYPAGAEECERALALLKDDTVRAEDSNWNRRYRDNLELIKKGDILSVAEVVKSLLRRDAEKGVSAGEKRMLIMARQVLITEMSVSLGREEEELLREIGG